MPGIKIGEIGPKLGMKCVNNGYLGFEHVRIPRKNMLMKNNKVLADGTYVKSPSSVLTYGTMMFVRVVILRDVSNYLSKAVTIATRYSAVRRQSPIDPNKEEPQVIDHITQQYKLFPQLAKVFVIKLAADYIWDMYNQVTSELDRGDLERLPEVCLHTPTLCLISQFHDDFCWCSCTHWLAASKQSARPMVPAESKRCDWRVAATDTWNAPIYHQHTAWWRQLAPTKERIRFYCCKHLGKYSTSVSRRAKQNWLCSIHVGRYLLKSWDLALQGKPLVPTVAYLSTYVKSKKQKWDSSIPSIIQALEAVAAKWVFTANEHG